MSVQRNKVTLKKLNSDAKERYARLFSKKDGSAASFRSGRVILMPGENVGCHSTEASEEILIILEGIGKLLLGVAEEVDIEKDSAVYIPPQTLHDVKNTGKEALRYVFITA